MLRSKGCGNSYRGARNFEERERTGESVGLRSEDWAARTEGPFDSGEMTEKQRLRSTYGGPRTKETRLKGED